ncbi:MAG: flagellar hook-basal body complex protein FliE [Lachnospiraceae bacterium]|nr:flagellar hook-basal body complex protein FliE [Lachnospiraceae bacterium]
MNDRSEMVGRSSRDLKKSGISSFDKILESAKGMIKETEDYTNAAEEAELSYMLGLNDSISDLMVAQTKANVSLQYTVAVRNALVDAYKEIMALQF